MHPTTPVMTASPPESVVAFIPYLAAGLGILEGDEFLVIEAQGRNRYLQFASFGPNLRGETVGNTYLDPTAALSPLEQSWLLDNGWKAPDEGGNYWRHWEPAQPLMAATVAAVTLYFVHGVETFDELAFDSDGPGVIDAIFGATR